MAYAIPTSYTNGYNSGSELYNTVGSYLNPVTTQVTVPVIEPVSIEPVAVTSAPVTTTAQTTNAKPKVTDQIKSGWNGMSYGEKANTIMGTVGSLMNAYNGYKANKLAKQQFEHAKQVSEQNWQAQRKQTNSQLEDRQRRRVEEAQANGRTTTSVGDYMAKYGI